MGASLAAFSCDGTMSTSRDGSWSPACEEFRQTKDALGPAVITEQHVKSAICITSWPRKHSRRGWMLPRTMHRNVEPETARWLTPAVATRRASGGATVRCTSTRHFGTSELMTRDARRHGGGGHEGDHGASTELGAVVVWPERARLAFGPWRAATRAVTCPPRLRVSRNPACSGAEET
jgi:hypothetical protein